MRCFALQREDYDKTCTFAEHQLHVADAHATDCYIPLFLESGKKNVWCGHEKDDFQHLAQNAFRTTPTASIVFSFARTDGGVTVVAPPTRSLLAKISFSPQTGLHQPTRCTAFATC